MNTRDQRILICALASLAFAGVARGQDIKNVAAPSAGGRIVFSSSQYDAGQWKADNLIDGSTDQGWSARTAAAQSVIIGFQEDGLVEMHDILINPFTSRDPNDWAKEVEFFVSTTYPFKDFRSVGTMTLEQAGTVQVFTFDEPVQARYLKLRFLSSQGGRYMAAGEVEVMGQLLREGPPAPAYTNVAPAEQGTKIERYTSQYDEGQWAVANLVDEDPNTAWSSKSAAVQEVVLALPEPAEFTDLTISNYTPRDVNDWAKDVRVEVSTTYSYKDFSEVGTISLPQIGDLHTLSLSEAVSAKYIKLVFLSNHGGRYMAASGVRLYRRENAGSMQQQLEETGRAVIHEILFAFNSAEILPESDATLNQIAKLLQETPDVEFVIEGHTDNVGAAEFNLELSRDRAQAVKTWLVDNAGIDPGRLTPVGHGLTRPIADNGSNEGRARNRRVELVKT